MTEEEFYIRTTYAGLAFGLFGYLIGVLPLISGSEKVKEIREYLFPSYKQYFEFEEEQQQQQPQSNNTVAQPIIT